MSAVKGNARYPQESGNMSRRVYSSLRERIVGNEFLPGQPISENEIAAQYGVSRTPVREALRRLEQDRLVTRGRLGRGYLVRLFDLDEMDEIYDVRISLEELALRTVSTRLTPETVDGLREALDSFSEPLTPGEALDADERFHLSLVSASGNRTLQEFLEKVNHRIHIIRGIDFWDSDRRKTSKAEHDAILAALLGGDVEEASRLLEHHILESKATCERLTREGLAMVYKPRRSEERRDIDPRVE